MTGPSSAPSDDPLTTALAERWQVAGRANVMGFRLGLVVALAGHLLLGTALTGGLDALWVALGGAAPAAVKRIGDERGTIDGVSAELIDAAEFNKRYIAFKAGTGEADSEAAPRQPAQDAKPQPAEPEKPAEQPVAELKPGDGWAPSAVSPTPDKPPSRKPDQQAKETPPEPAKPEPQKALTEAEMRELLAQSMDEVASSLVAVSAPGAARLGEASPFVKSVIRTLKSNMPRPAGMKGNVVIQLIVGVTGEIEGLRIVKSSGRPELDRLVAERVYKTRLASPPATASLRERLFQITYSYN